MPPMSRPLMTACATISTMRRRLRLQQRRAGVFLRKHAGKVPFLPLHADRMAVDVLPVRTELHPSARGHRRVAIRHVQRGKGVAHLLRIGGSYALERIGEHEGLRDEPAGILEDEVAGALLV